MYNRVLKNRYQNPKILLNRVIRDCRRSFYTSTLTFSSHFENSNPQKKRNHKKNNKHQHHKKKVELTYEEESDHYLATELNKELEKYKTKNQKVSQIVSQFRETVELYGLKLEYAPLFGFNNRDYQIIHLSKKAGEEDIDILLDYKCKGINDAHVLVTNSGNESQLLYLMGNFRQSEGFNFHSCIVIDANKIGKSVGEIKSAICSGSGWIFKSLGNLYEKQLDIMNPNVVKFLKLQNEDDFNDESPEEVQLPDLDGKQLIDALLNFAVNELITGNGDHASALYAVLEMLSNYSRNSDYGQWICDFKSFVEIKKKKE